MLPPPTRYDVKERTSSVFTATLLDEAGVAVAGSTLNSLTLTVYDRITRQIIERWNARNVLNTNGVTVDEDGLLTWDLQPADNRILNDTLAVEVHVAVFRYTWAGGAKGWWHAIELAVANERLITT